MNKHILNVETPEGKRFELALFDTSGEAMEAMERCQKIKPEGWYWLSWVRDYVTEDTTYLYHYPKEERRFILREKRRRELEDKEEKLKWQRDLGFED